MMSGNDTFKCGSMCSFFSTANNAVWILWAGADFSEQIITSSCGISTAPG